MNKEIRLLAKGHGVPFWKICGELGISEPTFTRLMRKPLDEEKKAQIKAIIERLSTLGGD